MIKKFPPCKRKEIWKRMKKDLFGYWKPACWIVLYLIVGNLLFGTFCPMVLLTGLPCPGCGVTRALLLVLQLRFVEAWNMHPLIYGWMILTIIFVIRRYGMGKSGKELQKYAILLLIAMIFVYIYRMKNLFPYQEPMTYFPNNVLEMIRKHVHRS